MVMVLEIPEELGVMVAALRSVVDVAMKQVERGHLGGAAEYAAFERTLSEKLCEVERCAHHATLRALDIDEPRLRINGIEHARVLRAATTFMSMAGEVPPLERTLYRPVGERNAATVDLVALRAGAVEGVWLPTTAREMAFDLQQLTSREAEANGKRKGRLPYSHSSFERVGHAVGEMYVQQHHVIEQRLIEKFEVPREARSVSVSLDRVSVPMEEPVDPVDPENPPDPPDEDERDGPADDGPKIRRAFRMAYCATVTLHDGGGEGIQTFRYGTMPDGDPQGLCAGLADDVIAILAKRPDLRVGLLCDGAPEMWNLLDEQFTKRPFDTNDYVVVRLLDFWHVIEKLAAAAKLLADGDSRALVARWKLLLLNKSSARATILRELLASGLEDVHVGESKPVHEAITYLRNNAKRMNYAAARQRGLPIGSGNVEATCKSLVEIRMRRAGARWKSRTGEHIIHLRALALSDRWDGAMDIVFKPPRVQVRLVAA